MDWQSFVNQSSKPVKNDVTLEKVRSFAKSIGEASPLFFDEAYVNNSVFGKIIAPPTFPRTFDYGDIEGFPLPKEGLIHGEQEYEYNRPLFVGDTVYCKNMLENVTEKKGRNGRLVFLFFKQTGMDENGDVIFIQKRTLIMTESVLKEIETIERS